MGGLGLSGRRDGGNNSEGGKISEEERNVKKYVMYGGWLTLT